MKWNTCVGHVEVNLYTWTEIIQQFWAVHMEHKDTSSYTHIPQKDVVASSRKTGRNVGWVDWKNKISPVNKKSNSCKNFAGISISRETRETAMLFVVL